MTDEIDDFIDQWHEGDSEDTLSKFLGMTDTEYKVFVAEPGSLGMIIAAKAQQRPLTEAVNDNYADFDKIAARSKNSGDMKRLKEWITELESA
ncbi:hypothetical protein [uncultured Parasphingorhabdus sp.]|uniref:hypothetical protein n=1 Tax=uncultured Parasphingorhabdus sp. TaxID=2709694 RepID=UPI002AA60C66|nr:hypothetical protein [uncultured Parasphingorhabdus sp.]